jgi:type IV pilus assembly protein PilM
MIFFNKKIINLEDKFFALDLNDLSVKAFQIDRDGKNDKIRSYGYSDIPQGYIEDGRILEKDRVAGIIKATIKKSGPKKIKTKKVVCSVPESKAFLRIITAPKMNESEAAEALKWEIEASIPLTCDQVYFDWQLLEEVGDKQRILTVAVSKEVVDNLMEVLFLAGLDVYCLELDSIACVRSLIPQNSDEKEISLIVDIGAKRTSFIISEGQVPSFTSSVPFSSEVITDIISQKMGIGKKEAEEIKISRGIEKSFENGPIFNIVKPFLENLSVEIEKSVDFYQTISKNRPEIEKIILCGGGANLRGLVPYLTTRLLKEVTIGDPWVNLRLGNNLPIIDKEKSVRFATVIGLALRKSELWK